MTARRGALTAHPRQRRAALDHALELGANTRVGAFGHASDITRESSRQEFILQARLAKLLHAYLDPAVFWTSLENKPLS